jgi:hypothetical protein
MMDVFAIGATLRCAFEVVDLTADPDRDLLAMLDQCPAIPDQPRPLDIEQ